MEKIKEKKEEREYKLPSVQLLETNEITNLISKKELADIATKLQKTLYSFDISAKVESIVIGPISIIYEIRLSEGISYNRVKKLKDDLALNLKSEIIDINPITEKQLVGIQIEKYDKDVVRLGEIIRNEEFINSKSKLTVGLGKDIYGNCKIIDIEKTSHILISGTTGSGKSMFLHTLLISILYKAKPDEVKFLIINPNGIEFSLYSGLPPLLIPVITDKKKAYAALNWICQEMENRYLEIANKNVKNIKEYNEIINNNKIIPEIIVIIDEYTDFIDDNIKEIEKIIYELTQRGKNVGIYLVVSIRKPLISVINGTVKANFNTRIAFKLLSQKDSRLILDDVGAENLLGNGDMLFKELGTYKPIRIQGAFILNKEIEKVINYIKENYIFNEDIIEETDENELEDEENDIDSLLMEAIKAVVETGQASTSFIQRRFKVGYARAGRIIDQMEERGVISGYQGSIIRRWCYERRNFIRTN